MCAGGGACKDLLVKMQRRSTLFLVTFDLGLLTENQFGGEVYYGKGRLRRMEK